MGKRSIQRKLKPAHLPCPCNSGKPFKDCHGLNAQLQPEPPPPPMIGGQVITRKLDLACGQNKKAGFEGVDWIAAPGVDIVHDLNVYPWPFEDNSIVEINCSHYIEHIPMEYLQTPTGPKDALLAFFDECYRILVPDGMLVAQWPNSHSDRAFQDPTHRRFIPVEMTLYLSAQWRKQNKLDHYNASCDFECGAEWLFDSMMGTMSPEVQQRKFRHEWNAAFDNIMRAKAIKPQRA